MNATSNLVKDALLGIAVGDALGVPVEFQSRAELKLNPVTGMRGFGTHNQPPGTWSDDSSLTFCLAESLCWGYDIKEIASNFVAFYRKSYWTAGETLFDIGNHTRNSIERLERLIAEDVSISHLPIPEQEASISENGNGALMRILPLVFFVDDEEMEDRIRKVAEIAALTHGHPISHLCCAYYVELALLLVKKYSFEDAYTLLNAVFPKKINEYFPTWAPYLKEIDSVLSENIYTLSYKEISSSGYVVHTLEAALWCMKRFNSYKEIVLEAVNLGDDTDTTAAVVGGLAGIYYGSQAIPKSWMDVLWRAKDIELLAERLSRRFY